MKHLVDYQGRQIRITNERMRHILEHPEMANMEKAITTALLNPEIVRQSRTDTAVYLYYLYQQATLVGDKWLCVVVKYLPDDAFIVTAYFTDKPKKGETLWQSE